MPELTGAVRCVRVAPEAGFTRVIEQGTNTAEIFILWWDGITTPANPAASLRIAQSDWVGLLRQAMASNIPVTVTTDTNSAIVLNVQLGTF